MRRYLEIAALAALALLLFITIRALYGPAQLPQQIPTHFTADGHADAYGSPSSLFMLPLVALLLYVLMTVVARFPASFNFPVRVTPLNRTSLESLAINMIAWLKAELMLIFAGIQLLILRAARSGQGNISPMMMPIVLGIVFATTLWHFLAMRRAGK
jgi:uncharacterized membrane protein